MKTDGRLSKRRDGHTMSCEHTRATSCVRLKSDRLSTCAVRVWHFIGWPQPRSRLLVYFRFCDLRGLSSCRMCSQETDSDARRWKILHLWRDERSLWDITHSEYRKTKLHKQRWELIATKLGDPDYDGGKMNVKCYDDCSTICLLD